MPKGIYTRTKEMREGMSGAESNNSKAKRGAKNYMFGKHHTPETILLQRKLKLGKYDGKNNPNWKGGISFKPYGPGFTSTIRIKIRERDKYICQKCNTSDNHGKTFNVHHIDYDKNNNDPSNLITLCTICNSQVNANRKYWTDYFIIKISSMLES